MADMSDSGDESKIWIVVYRSAAVSSSLYEHRRPKEIKQPQERA